MHRLLIATLLFFVIGCTSNPSAPALWHTVEKGETLYSISRHYGQDLRKLAAANRLEKPYTIYPGQSIRLLVAKKQAAATASRSPWQGNKASPWQGSVNAPWQGNLKKPWQGSVSQKQVLAANGSKASSKAKSAQKTVKSSKPVRQSTSSASQSVSKNTGHNSRSNKVSKPVRTSPPVGKSTAALTGVNKKHSSNNKSKWRSLKWRWPANGTVSGHFSPSRELQQGIDITGRANSPVMAAEAGKVIYSGSGLRGYGKLVIIKHSELFISAYAHNRLLLVQKGDFVKSGQKIAEMGSTPQKKVHLHFQIRYDGRAVDPLKYLPKRAGG